MQKKVWAMKVLHVNMSMNTRTGGGTVERILQLHKALLAMGAESHILTINSLGSNHANLPANEVTTLPCLNERWLIPYPKIAIVRSLIEWADVIHLSNHWTLINTVVYLLARKLEKPYFVCPAGALTIYGRSKILKRAYQYLVGKRLIKNAAAAIAISPDEIEQFSALGVSKGKIIHIPNGVNEEDFAHPDVKGFREVLGLVDLPYILFLGRLNAIKGPDLLLKAFIALSDAIPHVLVFVGPDGGMLEELEVLADDNGLKERVFFAGFAGGDLKAGAYSGADVLVVPSRHEAMSIVALEAAISGVPVLMTDQCGFQELVHAGAALEVSATEEGVIDGLRNMLVAQCQLEIMGQKGKKFAQERFTWEIAAEKYLSIFTKVRGS
ncbi:MAG: glycosyltransferase [Gammaproteobacteria bacterium]|nr:MAG: glycosyltransferase [Gammaproteobacteria bacterium]